MKASYALKAFARAGKRTLTVGDLHAGVIIALDMEGRLFTVLGDRVLNRINPEAIAGHSTREGYLNPGGDALWPAPEGTAFGYQYSTGAWRVAPGLRAARYVVSKVSNRIAEVVAEVDLINAQGRGIPTLFRRSVSVSPGKDSVTVRTVESITFIGHTQLQRSDCLLAPWSLCQFDSGPHCEVVFPCANKADVWDLYEESSDAQRQWTKSLCRTVTDGSQKYQIGLGQRVPWIEFRDPHGGLVVRRSAALPRKGQTFIDIRDAAPSAIPDRKGVRYSVYSDTSKFMEVEAAGGCPPVIEPGLELSLEVTTQFRRI